MIEPPRDAAIGGSPRARLRRSSILGALTLAAIVTSCGGRDPAKPFESLQSAAETARLTVRERLEGSVSERYATDALASLASTLPELRAAIGQAAVGDDLRHAGLTGSRALEAILDDARTPGASRAEDAARLDALAGSLAELARAAGAKED